MIDFELFDGLLKVHDNLRDAGNNLIAVGFDINSRHVSNIFNEAEKIIDLLNKNMGLKKDSAGYTTIDWFIENKNSGDEDLHKITVDGKVFMIYSNADLYKFLTEVEL